MSLIKGSRKASNETGLFLGSRYDGTNPVTYTSLVEDRSAFAMVAIDTSIAPED